MNLKQKMQAEFSDSIWEDEDVNAWDLAITSPECGEKDFKWLVKKGYKPTRNIWDTVIKENRYDAIPHLIKIGEKPSEPNTWKIIEGFFQYINKTSEGQCVEVGLTEIPKLLWFNMVINDLEAMVVNLALGSTRPYDAMSMLLKTNNDLIRESFIVRVPRFVTKFDDKFIDFVKRENLSIGGKISNFRGDSSLLEILATQGRLDDMKVVKELGASWNDISRHCVEKLSTKLRIFVEKRQLEESFLNKKSIHSYKSI